MTKQAKIYKDPLFVASMVNLIVALAILAFMLV